MRNLWILLCILGLLSSSATVVAQTSEMFLIGGSLNLCSSTSLRHCSEGPPPAGRAAAVYRVDATGIEALNSSVLLAHLPQALRTGLQRSMQRLARQSQSDYSASALYAAMMALCSDPADVRQPLDCQRSGAVALWRLLTDAEQAGVMSALEQAQTDASGQRIKEAVSLQRSNAAGAEILRQFVAAAASRADGQRPRIAIVTASSLDPFDAVDYYLDALTQAGADPRWLPLDRAVVTALASDSDCGALEAIRQKEMILAKRAVIYPDLAAIQRQFCEQQRQTNAFPNDLHGIFFGGGDQERLRRTLVDFEGRPSVWLQGLLEGYGSGSLVIGGTSAGAAVQAGGVMVSNGGNSSALRLGALAAAPPEPGCEASFRCGAASDASRLTFSAEGGLNSLPDMTVDTHFSERAREWRLMALLSDSDTHTGIGVDETTAAWLRQDAERPALMEVIGAGSATLIHSDGPALCQSGQYKRSSGRIYRVPAGRSLVLTQPIPFQPDWPLPENSQARPDRHGDLFEPGVLSDRIARFAATGPGDRQQIAALNGQVQLTLDRDSQSRAAPSYNGQLGYVGVRWTLDRRMGEDCQ